MSHCGVSGKFLNIISTPISKPMSILFNNLFREGIYPDTWKISHVTPIYKHSGPKCEKSNFRPISLLPTISKICEAVIHHRLLDHCLTHKVITDRQAAYLKGDSTTNQLLYIIHQINLAWGNANLLEAIFLDISAAFDKIWHKGLLSKLNQIGINGKFLQLFQSYLSNRTQITVIDGVKSSEETVQAGCPQGSKLGPLLFIIYINDIQKELESEILLFADDTSLLATGSDPAETTAILNRDLAKIEAWSKIWKVTFNSKKSKAIICSRKTLCNSPALLFCGNFIERVVNHKHLGVVLNSTLDWTVHINYICKRANQKLSILRSVKYLDRQTLDLLYKLTVRSRIDYGLHIFYHSLTQQQKDRLSRLQYRAAKLVTGAPHCTSQVKLEHELGWETISNRAQMLGLSVYFKIHSNMMRPLILKCLPERDENLYNLRNNGNLRKCFPYKNAKFSKSYFPYFTKLWNKLPQNIRCSDFDTFKEKLYLHYKPTKYKFFNAGTKQGNKIITLLRVGRSQLNAHSFNIGQVQSPQCSCGLGQETSCHILTVCPLYHSKRLDLFNLVQQQISSFPKLNRKDKTIVLLFGFKPDNPDFNFINKNIAISVQDFLLKIKKFSFK